MPNNHSNTDVVGPEILACSGGHSTHQFAPPSVEKFGLENARKAFAKASKISHPVTTRAAGNRFMLETDEHVIVDSGGEECISAGNIWRVNRLDRGHDLVMVTEVQHRTGSGHLRSFDRALRWTFERRLSPDNGPSSDGHARQVIGRYSRLQCSRNGRSSIENTVNLVSVKS